MKKAILSLVLCTLSLCTFTARANDYLEVKKHYSVYAVGESAIRIKVPIWAYGRWNNYYANSNSYVYFQEITKTKTTEGKDTTIFSQKWIIFNYQAARDSGNVAKNGMGMGAVHVTPGRGTVVVNSTYNGVKQQINDDGQWVWMTLTQKEDDDCSQATILDVDWYPQEDLVGKSFRIGIDADITQYWPNYRYGTFSFLFTESFTGGQNLPTPQLYSPYLYMVGEEGVAGYGYAAVPYMTFQTPLSYTTSRSNSAVEVSGRSGTIYVPTTDTVQSEFSARFILYRNEALGTTTEINTPPVDVPAYHRLYDLRVTEQKDSSGSLTGANIIRWAVRSPMAKDLVQDDYFEVQRAYKSDFSDAQSLSVVNMRRDTMSEYTFIDNSRSAASGYAVRTDTINRHVSISEKDYILTDAEGNPLYSMDLTLTSNQFVMPAAPVYYRVRRASSAVWGWEHEFAQHDTLYKHNYLAPLATTQPDYTLDKDFANNRTVHFNIRINNADIQPQPLNITDCELSYRFKQSKVAIDTIVMHVHVEQALIDAVDKLTFATYYPSSRQELHAGDNLVKMAISGYDCFRFETQRKSDTYYVDEGGLKELHYIYDYNAEEWNNATLSLRVQESWQRTDGDWGYIFEKSVAFAPAESGSLGQAQARWETVQDQIKLDLYNRMTQNSGLTVFGKCIWDRSAKLVLIRTSVESGSQMEIIVPQDSIRRAADGSWTAHITDVADAACTHYSYSVRIDPSDADLRLQDSASLLPVAIHGPELYFNEAASVTSFTATQGDAQAHNKAGIRLQWRASSSAVDEFILLRQIKGTSDVPDTLYRGQDFTWFDETAVPNVHYEYTIVSTYACNGHHTDNSATAEGWRTAYGQISGAVLMPDNSGMAGVTIQLSSADRQLSAITDATGVFVFDSLTYDLASGTVYTIIPTSQYGTFSYNNTSSGSATFSLSAGQPVVNGLAFVNTSAVRLSGRVLYDLSSIPVSGVSFLLNGDTIHRSGQAYRTGTDGSFEITVPKSMPCSLQAIKAGHTFLNDGFLQVETGSNTFSLVKALDGVRFYDQTKVRLIGRVAGGLDQQDLPLGQGLGKNNLGDDLQLVLMLEGDNTAHIVHDPDDLSRDTVHQRIEGTHTLFEQKRITIQPDPATGEYAVDLFPVKYKVVQATARGYATLFPSGIGSETFDLTRTPLDTLPAVYNRIYRSPVQVQLTQLLYGMEQEGYGEPRMTVSELSGDGEDIPMYTKNADGTISYLLGHPVFIAGRKYQFLAQAFEDYYYNNDRTTKPDRVAQRGGHVKVHNGMQDVTSSTLFPLDEKGQNKNVLLPVEWIDVTNSGEGTMRTVTVALETEGSYVESAVINALVSGNKVLPSDLRSTDADVVLLDIIRDPGGMGSSTWVEAGTTYKYAYTDSYKWEAGLEITPKYGLNVSQDIGMISAVGGIGTYIGSTYTTSKQLSLEIPIVHSWKWGYKFNYDITTTDRISTSSSYSNVGSNADVFLGTTVSMLCGKARSIGLISDSLWQARQPAYNAGTLKLLASGTDSLGHRYYLVTGQKVVAGTRLNNTFVYTQAYILNTLIPNLAKDRQNILEQFADQQTAQAAADARDEAVYWDISEAPAGLKDTLGRQNYVMVVPQNTSKVFNDEVAALDNMIFKWLTILYQNEKEKVMARMAGRSVGTWSVSGGTSIAHSDNYSASSLYNEMPQGWGLVAYEAEAFGVDAGRQLVNQLGDILEFWGDRGKDHIGKSVSQIIDQYLEAIPSDGQDGYENVSKQEKSPVELGTVSNVSKWSCSINPVLSFDNDDNISMDKTISRKTGFTISPDPHGDITVSVYRAPLDSLWEAQTALIREKVETDYSDDLLYGNYVFYTVEGTTYCPHEAEERTQFFNKGTLLNAETQYAAKPAMTINTQERVNVPADQKAIFQLHLKLDGLEESGKAASGEFVTLSLSSDCNPNGAKVTVDGVPLSNGLPLYITPGTPVTKTMEVERGLVDDYENMVLFLSLNDCPKVYSTLSFSVHFLPESSPVTIAAPRDKWVMNTLSARDSVGYYLPIEINGFDVQHRNFDHIDFQYKLSTENEDAWVTQCSFYADDSLYNLATGNKARIENGRIAPFRFYGERDPKELNYDLRAVSFCRHGSGFVTKASPIISGTKDTRPPVLFGKAQPANGILTLEDNIALRFSEPIAGNWLDEDNNFQILGVTNATGITQSTSLYIGGQSSQYLESEAGRELAITDLTVDMMIKPAETGRDMALFAHGDSTNYLLFMLTSDNRLKVVLKDDDKQLVTLQSKPMAALSATDFTRVMMVYDFWKSTVRFYAGTLDITDVNHNASPYMLQNDVHPLRFGKSLFGETNNFKGNMMEVRLWTKALTPDEIANTHLRRLTGYEHGLMDYYPMDEGEGSELTDLASGATLNGSGLSWTNPQGISVALGGEAVELNPLAFSRNATQDYTLMGWFRSENRQEESFSLFSTALADSVTMETGFANGRLFFRQDDIYVGANAAITDGEWHHIAISVSKSYNVGTLYLDGEVLQTFTVHTLGGLTGTKISAGKGLIGNIDDICLFEQALPATLVQECRRSTPNGDEMGLIALLPFSETKRNAANVMELVFSVNDQRVFKDPNGNVVNKVVPLVITNDQSPVSDRADKTNYAPVTDRGHLTNLHFIWSYKDEELLINLNMQDREINKRTLYLTVRDVEDLNGNRLVSPVSWSVYADLNSLRWEKRRVDEEIQDASINNTFRVNVNNTTGMTRQFTIDNLPEWLDCSPKQGTIGPEDEEPITFTVKKGLTPGKHNAVIFLTDDKGLSESLVINIEILSICPWDELDTRRYKQNMSLRAQVFISHDGTEIIDTDKEDIVGIFCNGELVGKGNISGEDFTRGFVYITVYGDASFNGRTLTAQLWRHATAKTYLLSADVPLKFKESSCLGCPPDEPVRLTTSDNMMQSISLDAGWTWTSFYIIPEKNGVINSVLMSDTDFDANDEIKSPATGNFCRYNDSFFLWQGSLSQFNYRYIHMFHTAKEQTIHIFGTALLTDEDRTIPLKQGWNVFPYLRMDNKNLRDALSPYYAYASEGDMIKSHDEFAVFSANGKWEGNLSYLQPGRGYLFFRQGNNEVSFTYPASSSETSSAPSTYRAPFSARHATNMTMIAKVHSDDVPCTKVNVFIGEELVGVAKPLSLQGEPEEAYYFLTISSDVQGELRFETQDGTPLTAEQPITYVADNHHGTLKAPIVLCPGDNRPYKIIENNHVIIIRNNEKYDITGKKL